MKRACVLHDRVNLLVLPFLGASTVLGLLGVLDTYWVSVAFTAYIIGDFFWILAVPEAVPSLPNVILLHHVVTFGLLCFPLMYPALGVFTCWDGLCEINTFFLIARRQWRSARGAFSVLYWGTFLPMRVAIYPLMLLPFCRATREFPWWQRALVLGCQLVLIGFNMVLLHLSIMNWRKRAPAALQRGAAVPAGAAGGKLEVRRPVAVRART